MQILSKLPAALKENYAAQPAAATASDRSDSSTQAAPSSPIYVVPSQFHEPAEKSVDSYLDSIVLGKAASSQAPRSIAFPNVIPVRKMIS